MRAVSWLDYLSVVYPLLISTAVSLAVCLVCVVLTLPRRGR